MHLLVGLADEVLAGILELVSLDVVTLWMTGDANLQTRMMRCCRAVRSSPEMRHRKSLKRWPRMLSQLTSLQVLVLGVIEINEDIAEVSKQIRRLPSSLVELELSFRSCARAMLQSPPAEGVYWRLWRFWNSWTSWSPRRAWNGSVNRESDNNLIEADRECGVFWSFAARFPHLKKIDFRDTVTYPGPMPHVPANAAFHHFPPCLEHLHLDFSATGWDGFDDFSPLPRSLTSLRIGRYTFIDASAAKTLPPNLTHLGPCMPRDLDTISKLPRTLRSGEWLGNLNPECPKWFRPTHIRLLLAAVPPSTETLYRLPIVREHFESQNIQWPTALPNSLTVVSFLKITLRSDEVALLPRTLTKIHLLMLDFPEFYERSLSKGDIQQIWPPALKFLHIEQTQRIPSAHMIGVLPSTITSLTNLHTEDGSSIFDSLSKHFPHLQELDNLSNNDGQTTLSQIFVKTPFPTTLRKLYLVRSLISPSSFAMLPRGLVILWLPTTSLEDPELAREVAKLPRTVEKMAFDVFHQSALPHLPPSLTALSVSSLEGKPPHDFILPERLKVETVQNAASPQSIFPYF